MTSPKQARGPVEYLTIFAIAIILFMLAYILATVIGQRTTKGHVSLMCKNGSPECSYYLDLPDSTLLKTNWSRENGGTYYVKYGDLYGVVGKDSVLLESRLTPASAKDVVDRYRAKSNPIRVPIK